MEIPFYFGIHYPIFTFVGQPVVYGVYSTALDIYFCRHWKINPVLGLAKSLYLYGTTGLLSAKIIARKTHDDQFIAIRLVKLLQLLVLRGVATFRSNINNHYLLSSKTGKIYLISSDPFYYKLMDSGQFFTVLLS